MTLQGLTYTFHEQHIHEFVMHNMHNTTMGAFFDHLEMLQDKQPRHEVLRLLIQPSGIGSIQYVIARAKALRQKYPAHRSRVAIVYAPSVQGHFLQMAMRGIASMTTTSTSMFPKPQLVEAMVWLAH